MNILFLTLSTINDINCRGIYTDLMRKFRNEGHKVTIVCPIERRYKQKTQLYSQENINILKVWTLNIQKTNIIEKGLGTILLEIQFFRSIKKHFNEEKFDLIIYSTPPITLTSVIRSIKDRNRAKTYLLLKDIFPQNAVDMGMISPINPLFHFFRRKEKKLYELSDYIGCMSPANVTYLLKHNSEIIPEKVEVNPNSIELIGINLSSDKKVWVRNKYHIPINKTVFVFGGNMGKPQGLDFLLEIIQASVENEEVFFLLVGAGTEYSKLKNWFDKHKPRNSILLSSLPKEEYDQLVQSCDVGLIFLDRRFTIPNFPSRLLSYLEYKMPIIAATDPNTDIGKIAEDKGFGFSVLNGDLAKMKLVIDIFINNKDQLNKMGDIGFEYLKQNYLVEHSYQKIVRKINV